jgi:hypothetical protein
LVETCAKKKMNRPIEYLELRCTECPWAEVCGPEEMAAWLLRAKKVRRGREPESEVMAELLRAAAPQLACPECGHVALAVGPAPEDSGNWPEAICESCSQPIPRERLEAVPGTTLCVQCQRKEELERALAENEYCPKCGAPMEVRQSRSGGLARYVLVCTGEPPCRL